MHAFFCTEESEAEEVTDSEKKNQLADTQDKNAV